MSKKKDKKSIGLWIFLGLVAITAALVVGLVKSVEDDKGKGGANDSGQIEQPQKPSGRDVKNGDEAKPQMGNSGSVLPPVPSAQTTGPIVQIDDRGRTNFVSVSANGQTNSIRFVTPPKDDKLKKKARIYRRRLDPGATKRLATNPQEIKTVIVTTGRAENADWGFGGIGSFVLTLSIDCDAEIVQKEETAGGEIKVVEKRTFHECRQGLRVFDTDARFRLYDTLPLKETFTVLTLTGGILSVIPQTSVAGASILAGTAAASAYLKKIDGTSARDLLELLKIDVPETVKKTIDEFVTSRVENILQTANIEGKSYLITYYQDKDSGSPLRVDFTNADGSEIKTEGEYLILRRANAFLDSQVVPDKNCSPGDRWNIDMSDFESVLEPYVEGAYCGEVTVKRLDNDQDGDWRLGLSPCKILVKSDAGRTTGEMRLKNGEAKVDAENVIVRKLTVKGRGNLQNLSKHHLLFNSRFEGDCEFSGVLETMDLSRQPAK